MISYSCNDTNNDSECEGDGIAKESHAELSNRYLARL